MRRLGGGKLGRYLGGELTQVRPHRRGMVAVAGYPLPRQLARCYVIQQVGDSRDDSLQAANNFCRKMGVKKGYNLIGCIYMLCAQHLQRQPALYEILLDEKQNSISKFLVESEVDLPMYARRYLGITSTHYCR